MENMDHSVDLNGSQDDILKLRIDDAIKMMKIARRTFYTRQQKEGWKKIEGIRGEVWYMIPRAYIEQCTAEAQSDNVQLHQQAYADIEQVDAVHAYTYEASVQEHKPAYVGQSTTQDVIGFMQKTMDRLEGYSNKINELSIENARFKLLTEMAHKTEQQYENEITQLKNLIFEKDYKIKELEAALKKKDWKFWK